MKDPLVSVIISCYNYGKYVEEAISSVQNQTYKNIELIVINDGSTDNSDQVIGRLLKKQIFQYIKQANQGIIATRNKGIKQSKGEYIVQLDADDYLDLDYVEQTMRTAAQTGADVVYTNVKGFDEGNYISDFPEFNLEILKNSNFIHISSLLKKGFIKHYKFDEKFKNRSHEDWDFFLNVCIHGGQTVLCKNTLLNYRIHKGSRNNKLSLVNERKNYAELYTYIINKYSRDLPNAFNYLSGKQFADWYIKLLEEKNKTISVLLNDVNVLNKKVEDIYNSKSYKLGHYILWSPRHLVNLLTRQSNRHT